MGLEAFNHSEPLTLGVELELQLVNTHREQTLSSLRGFLDAPDRIERKAA